MQRKDFNDLLLNREEVEKIIGMTITKSNAEDNYLEDYRMYPELCLHDVVCLCLGLHPKDQNAHQHPRYTVIYGALQQGAETGYLPSRRESDYYEGDLYYITHDTAREWAKANGLKWDVPPYKPVTFENEPLDKNHLETRNAQLEQEIARLQAEITELKAQPPQAVENVVDTAVDYNNFTIYGHTSENLEMLFTVAKKIADRCVPDNPHSYPTKEQLTEYIKKYYSDSTKLCEAIYQIVIPEKVKTRGRPPEGVETFKGFL